MIIFCLLVSVLSFAGELELADFHFQSGKNLEVEVADSFIERNKGLMGRSQLDANRGMLFIFDRPQKLSFWMKDTYIPLSIAYFDKNKVLKEIYKMKPQSLMEKNQDLKSYPSQCDCQYVLEVNQGWFKKNKIKVGDKFSFKLKSKK